MKKTVESPQQYYDRLRNQGWTDDITSEPNPDYTLPFYQNIFRMMEGYSRMVNDGLQKESEELLAKIAQIKATLPDNKIRDLNPIWVRDEIVKRLNNK